MKTQESKLKGFKVYEFYFQNDSKTNFCISKTKKNVKEMYDSKKVYLRDDIQIDSSCNYMEVLTGEKTFGHLNAPKKLEEFLNDNL